MERHEALKKLFQIKSSFEVDISDYLEELNKNEGVTEKVTNFIGDYEYNVEDFLEHLSTKEFYKSLKKSKNDYSSLKGLSSMLTHILIEIEQKPKQKKLIVDSLNVEEILKSLHDYFILDDSDTAKELSEQISRVIKKSKK